MGLRVLVACVAVLCMSNAVLGMYDPLPTAEQSRLAMMSNKETARNAVAKVQEDIDNEVSSLLRTIRENAEKAEVAQAKVAQLDEELADLEGMTRRTPIQNKFNERGVGSRMEAAGYETDDLKKRIEVFLLGRREKPQLELDEANYAIEQATAEVNSKLAGKTEQMESKWNHYKAFTMVNDSDKEKYYPEVSGMGDEARSTLTGVGRDAEFDERPSLRGSNDW